jgi:putative Mn2+ efflux pump MntP
VKITMKIRTNYVLATVFWIMMLIWGWQIIQIKNRHWLEFVLWIILTTIGYVWIMREFKNTNKHKHKSTNEEHLEC